MDLTGFLKVLLKRKYLIIGVSFLAAMLTYLITRQTSKIYLSKAQLATGITESAVPSESELGNPMVIEAKFSNLIEVITSKQVMSLLSYRLFLHDLYDPNPFRNMDDLRAQFTPQAVERAKPVIQNKLDSIKLLHGTEDSERIYTEMLKELEYDIKSIEKKLVIYRIENTDYIEIQYTSKNPYLSAFVVNTLGQEIIRYYNNITAKRLENSVKFFADASSQKKKDLDQKLDSMNRYKSNNRVINFEEERKSKMQQIATLEVSREEETKKIVGLRQAMATLNGRMSENESEDYDDRYMNNKILTLKNKLNTLQERYINSGNRDRKAHDSIQILKEELETQIGRFGNSMDIKPNSNKQEIKSKKMNIEIELEMAKANLSSIENTIYSLRNNLSGFATNETSIAAMEMAISVAKDEYLQVLDKFNAAKNFSMSSGSIHQIEFGEPSDEPEPSKVAVLTALAGIVTFVLIIVVLFTLEYIDSTIKRPSHFLSLTNTPLIGSLNQLKSSKVDFEDLFKNSHRSPVLETHKHLIRKLRYEIESSSAKVFLFTSTKPNEGKSFSIVSLAYSLALSGKKVLIIDTNFKNNTLTKLFAAKPGIKAFFEKKSDENIQESQAIDRTQVAGIDIVGNEVSNFSPFELLSKEKILNFIKTQSARYDYIFMEGAALNTYADTKELISLSDKVISIFSAKSKIQKSDNTSVAYLSSLNGKFSGAVLNKVDMENLDQ